MASTSTSSPTPNQKKKPSFTDTHLEYLKKRAVPPEFAVEAGLASLPVLPPKLASRMKEKFPGIFIPPCPTLCVPYRVDPLDGIARCRLRPDWTSYTIGGELEGTTEQTRDLPRWIAQQGVPVIPYYPLQIQRLFKDPKACLHVVEAPIKALALSANGFPAIGLGGVEAGFHDPEEWKKSKTLAMNRELARIDWRCRPATIVYDAGVQNNPRVALGAAKLALVLAKAGAKVRLALLPLICARDVSIDEALTYEPCDQGPDDFLGRHGAEGPSKLKQIIDQAVPANPVERAQLAMASPGRDRTKEVAELLEDLTFVAGLKVGGHLVIDQVASVVGKSGIKKRAIAEAVAKLETRLVESRPEDPADAIDLPYLVEQGRLAMEVTRAAKPSIRYLADFTAQIAHEVVKDDGVAQTREYRIEGTLADGGKLSPIDVAAEDFSSMDWITGWGSKAILRAGRDTRDHVRVAIQHLSQPTARTIYNHIGWRQVDGRWVYLHPAGAIGSNLAFVEVEIGNGRFCLPPRAENTVEALRASLSILNVAPLAVTLPAYSAAYTSVFATAFEVDFGLWYVGLTGTFKTSLSTLCISHFGEFDYRSVPANWYCTANYLEGQLFRWKDAPLLIDNYVPSPTQHQRELQAAALRIVQCIGDRGSRGRNNRNNEQVARRDPRALAIMTGEDLPPTNESTIGRLVVVDVPKGAISLERLRQCREKASLLPHAMRAFIEWIAEDYEGRTAQAREVRSLLADQLREALRPFGVHDRVPNNLAALGAGFSMLLDFARLHGVVDETVHEFWLENMLEVLVTLGRSQKANSEGSPTERYVSVLKTLVLQGRAVLVPVEQSLDLHTSLTSKAIGWINYAKREVYLVPDLAWEAIERFVGRDHWPYRQPRLQKQLQEQGLTKQEQADDDKQRTTCRRTAAHRVLRVLVFDYAIFEDVLGDSQKQVGTSDVQEVGMVLEFAAN